jgi:hypothetical protein
MSNRDMRPYTSFELPRRGNRQQNHLSNQSEREFKLHENMNYYNMTSSYYGNKAGKAKSSQLSGLPRDFQTSYFARTGIPQS